MAVTKLGAKLMSLEKRALFGFGKKQQTSTPSLWQRVGHGMGRACSFAMPGLMAFGATNSVASGENSLGGSLGELGGGLAGWSLGSKAIGALTKNMKPGFLKSGLGLVAPFFPASIGSGLGASMGDAVLPFRRKVPTYNTWLNEAADGWNGQS